MIRTLLLALLAAPAALMAQGTLRVEVRGAPADVPLAYAVVALPDRGVERFTDAQGVVVLPVDASGPLLVRVKRLGFVPRDTTLAVTAEPGQRLTVTLTRVSFRLEAVQVVAWPPCRRPGIPARGADPQLAGIIEQLRQNAERYRLLVEQYPFRYASEREFTRRVLGESESLIRRDTMVFEGRPDWRYEPGRLVSIERAGAGVPGAPRGWIMHIPLLSDLADERFIANHCFHVAGLEEKEGARLLRLDIVAAERLRGPDVNVTAWLDPAGFQLRHATFTLSRVPSQFRDLLQLTSRVTYAEVAPFIPVMEETVAENLVREGRSGQATVSYLERQRIVEMTFLKGRPDQ